MSLLLTLVRKDIRLLRWPWLGWIGVLLAQIALGVWCITSPHFGNDDLTRTTRLHLTLVVVGHVFAYMLVLRLVQADAPARSTAFWRTRPISGSRLLASKALVALLLFIVAPALVWLPWWQGNGFGPSALGMAAAELVLTQIAVLLPAFLIGSVTDSFSRAVLWSIVHYGLLICTPLLVKAPYEQTLDTGLTLSRWLLAAGVAALALPALIVWQFRTRRNASTITAYGILFVFVAVIAAYSPYDFKPRPGSVDETIPTFSGELTLRLERARFLHANNRSFTNGSVQLLTNWELDGLPPGLVVASPVARGNFSLSEGEIIQPLDHFAGTKPSPHPALLARIGVRELSIQDVTPPPASSHVSRQLSPELAARLRQEPPALTEHIRFRLFSPSLRFDKALVVGAWHADEIGGLRITRLQAAAGTFTTEHVFTRPGGLLREFVQWWRMPLLNRVESHPSRPYGDFLFNPSDGWISPLFHYGLPVTIGGVDITRYDNPHNSIVPFEQVRPERPSVAETTAWLSHLRLIRLSYREEARAHVIGHAESVVIEDAPKARASKQ